MVPPREKSFTFDKNNSPPIEPILNPVFTPTLLTEGNSIIFE